MPRKERPQTNLRVREGGENAGKKQEVEVFLIISRINYI
jgi:hypothetical protein